MIIPWPFPDDGSYPVGRDQLDPVHEDVRLATLVAQRLSVDWTTRRQQITVAVQNRVVILSGVVTDAHARQVAGELAADVPGVFDLCNALQFRGQRHGHR